MTAIMKATRECSRCGSADPAGGDPCDRCRISEAMLLDSARPASARSAPPLADEEEESVGTFGEYRILSEIGRGGMGRVYRARHIRLGREVALKMLLPEFAADTERIHRFTAEAGAVAALSHPHIVALYEMGTAEGQPYFSMELVDGENLGLLLRRELPGPERAAALLRTVAEAVHHAHQRGILHRDLKPNNILIRREDGAPMVADFGLAKVITAGAALTRTAAGTPDYMAPEQLEPSGGPLSASADIYALGGILYTLLTGQPPFHEKSLEKLLWDIYYTAPEFPRGLEKQLPGDLRTICLKCLEKDPRQRYRSAAELADDLGRYLRGEPVLALPVTALTRLVKWSRRNPALSAVWALFLLVAAGGVAAQHVTFQKVQTARAASEEIIGFMNSDLAADLRAIGRLDVMRKVQEKAAEYYRTHTPLGDDTFLERKALFYEQAAGTEAELGAFHEAAVLAREALDLFNVLAGRPGAPGAWDAPRGRVLLLTAEIARKAGRGAVRKAALAAASAWIEPALQEKRTPAAVRLVAGQAALACAALAIEEVRWIEADQFVSAAARLLDGASDPAAAAAAASCAYYLGRLAQSQGRPEEALAAFTAYASALEAISRQHSHKQWLFELAAGYGRIGESLYRVQQTGAAAQYFARQQAVAEELAAFEPRNVFWQSLHARSLAWRGFLAAREGSPDEALALLDRAVTIQGRLAALNPEWEEAAQDLFRTTLELCDLLVRRGQPARAVELAAALEERSLALLRRFPEHSGMQIRWGEALVEQGELTGRLHGTARKAAFFQASLGRLAQGLSGAGQAEGLMLGRARLLSRLANAHRELQDVSAAISALREAIHLRQEVCARTGGTPALIQAVISGSRWLASYHLELQAAEEARAAARECLEWLAAHKIWPEQFADLLELAGILREGASIPAFRAWLAEALSGAAAAPPLRARLEELAGRLE